MHDELHDRGLAHDLETMNARRAARRQLLVGLVAAGAARLVGCGGAQTEAATGSGGAGGSSSGGGGACAEIPDETAGPFPGDGTNGANALALSGIVRSDIRSSLGGAGGTADGVALTITLT